MTKTETWQGRLRFGILGWTLAGLRKNARGPWGAPGTLGFPSAAREYFCGPAPANGAPFRVDIPAKVPDYTPRELAELIGRSDPAAKVSVVGGTVWVTREICYSVAREASTFSIDLKWSLWTARGGEDFPREVLEAAEAAFDGTGPDVVIHTAPRKEIRFGTVTITRGMAEVNFWCEWDDLSALIPEWVPEDKRPVFEGAISDCFEEWDDQSPVPVRIQKTVRARTFANLMWKIDEAENLLLREEKTASVEFDKFIRDLAEAEGIKVP